MQKLIYDAAFPFSILGENGELVAYCDDDGLSEIDRKDAARRIVACVNACAGLPTEDLERMSLDKAMVGRDVRYSLVLQQRDELQLERDNYKSVAEAHSGAFQECIRLREQRDELLAALENAEEYLREYADAPILAVGLRSLISKVQK